MSTQDHIPSTFLHKLTQILDNSDFQHIIRWDKTGKNLSIACIQGLEEDVLPHYFRHSRYSSFVRQLNIYGFCKRKAEKNVAAAFHNQHFIKGQINYSGMRKKAKKLEKRESKRKIYEEKREKNQTHSQPDMSTSLYENQINFSAQNKPLKEVSLQDKNIPQINQLIAELSQRLQPLLGQEMEDCKWHQLQTLIRQPKYERVNYAVHGIMKWEEISPLMEVNLGYRKSDKMEFII